MKLNNGFKAFLLALTIADTAAFTAHTRAVSSRFQSRQRTTNFPRLFSSTLPSKTDTSDSVTVLAPDFDAARAQAIKMVEASGKVPLEMLDGLKHFINEYFVACSQNPGCSPESTTEMFLRAVEYGAAFGLGEDKYLFGTSHKAIRGEDESIPIDFYKFGCDFFRPTMDISKSVVIGEENLRKAFEQTEQGDNVVFLANHQSEADPQVFSCLLESCAMKEEGSHVTYVAGHKVTTDPLAIPFSMGRNLICIHSKKHIYADPETQPAKQRQNLSAMTDMLNELRKGGTALWVAPSGGRDRRDISTGVVPPAAFDQKTIDMFRLLGNKSKKNTHFYTLAMSTYDLCPPPDTVEASVNEKRNVRYVPVGIACSKELENIGGVESRHLFTEHAEETCIKDYELLLEAMNNK